MPARGRRTIELSEKGRAKLIHAVELLDSVLAKVCALILAMMVVITLVAIFFRYVLMNALSWTEELTRYMMVFVGMFGSALALWKDEHVGFMTVIDKWSPKWQKVAHIVNDLLVGILAFVMIFEGFKWIASSGTRAQILPIPMWIPLSVIPLGGVVLALVVFARIVVELGGSET